MYTVKIWMAGLMAAMALGLAQECSAVNVINYLSPRNAERPVRRDTYFIILHTTEGSAKGSLRKVWENGECHYFVDQDGKTYRIVDRDKVALHAGRSMWNGRTGIDDYSVGIEVVGNYNKDITAAQYKALSELLTALQKIYQVPDEKVLTHSMVAYGAPNRWHKKSHRGRKRCGMLFARDSVRAKLGLMTKPAYDPDVKAGRLVNADPQLAAVLYAKSASKPASSAPVSVATPTPTPASNPEPVLTAENDNIITKTRSAWDIARDQYKNSRTLYIFPDGKKKKGSEIRDWKNIPVGTKVIVDEDAPENEEEGVVDIGEGAFARDVAGDEYNAETTIYILPEGDVKKGSELTDVEIGKLPKGTRVLVGYVEGGAVTAKKSAFEICGKRWNFPSTYYLLKEGVVKAGNEIKENEIPPGTRIFYRQ